MPPSSAPAWAYALVSRRRAFMMLIFESIWRTSGRPKASLWRMAVAMHAMWATSTQ